MATFFWSQGLMTAANVSSFLESRHVFLPPFTFSLPTHETTVFQVKCEPVVPGIHSE